MFYRMLIAVPVAVLASTAAGGRLWMTARHKSESDVKEVKSSEDVVKMEASDVPKPMHSTSHSEQQQNTEKKYRTPSRFTLEDDDAIREALRCHCPPVGEATLNSGLSVEVVSW